MTLPAVIRALVIEAAERHEPFASILALAASHGVAPGELLRELEFDDCLDDPKEGITVWNCVDWVADLVAFFDGDVDRAQQALLASGRHSELDIRAHLRHQAHARRIQVALPSAPIAEVVALCRAFEPSFDWALDHLMHQRGLDELVAQRDGLPEERLRSALDRRFGRGAVVDAAYALLDDATATAWLFDLYALGPAPTHESAESAVRMRIAAQREAGRSLWEVVPFAEKRLRLEAWLPLFAEAGFQASFAALAALERGLSVSAAAKLMVASRFPPDSVLAALEECGAGPMSVLSQLRDTHWEIHALVAMARRAGHMDSEVRELLISLRVPSSEVATALQGALVRAPR